MEIDFKASLNVFIIEVRKEKEIKQSVRRLYVYVRNYIYLLKNKLSTARLCTVLLLGLIVLKPLGILP